MSSNTTETAFGEYSRFRSGTTKQSTTRGIVVSNVDPLFSGRVKVWIPAIHGPSPYDQDGVANIDPDIIEYSSALSNKLAGSSTFKDQNTINNLPWASVLSHNLGPSLSFESGLTTSAGVFTTPSIGTEVIIMFENDDPMLPVVVGSIIHANEFRYSLPRPLEMLPGVILSEVSQKDTPGNASSAPPVNSSSYPTLAPAVYNIRTGQGSTLFISDDPSNRAIVLEGSVSYDKLSVLTKSDADTLARLYPAFPTTASAAFAKREPLSTTGVSPLLAPTNLLSNDYISGTVITSVSPAAAINTPTTTTQSTVNSAVILQGLNDCAVSPTINKTLPVSGAFKPSGGADGKFHAPRPYGLHSGIDIHAEASGSTALIAPIDCFPLYIRTIPLVGYELLVLGVDGYGHGFLHLRSIDQNIQNIVNSGRTQLVKLGTPMGICGITAITSHNSGPHLHWDVWKAGSSAQTGIALSASRLSAINYNQTIDGFATWLHMSSNTQSSTVISSGNNGASSIVSTNTGTPEQVASIYNEFSVQYSSSDAVNFSKPAGLEMSLTPGKETIMLRHPSGSFIGFDPDGNILIYSCGDVNFRVNRSITYDVLGAIMESAYAKYSRIKTTIKNYSRMFFNYKAKDKADNTMPDFFSRVDTCRSYDMLNAVNSTINNSTIIDSSGNTIPPSSILPNNPTSSNKLYVYSALPTVYNYSLTTYDNILQTLYNKYISGYGTAGQVFTDISYFKSILLFESNGTQSMSPGGLFNLTNDMFQSVKNWVPSNTQLLQYISDTQQSYYDNSDIAFQYIKILTTSIISHLQNTSCGAISLNTNISQTDFIYLVLLSYAYGLTQTLLAIDTACSNLNTSNTGSITLTYKAVEAICIPRLLNTSSNTNSLNPILAFVPTVELIRTKISQL